MGFIGTMVNRSVDQWTENSLRSNALVGGVDLRNRFLKGRYQITGRVVGSRVTGSADAIAATQRSSVHYFQRPDAGLPFDATTTSLGGDAEQVTFGKVGGGLIRFETSYERVSPGFESNDLGFLRRADFRTGPPGRPSISTSPPRSTGGYSGTSTSGMTGPRPGCHSSGR